MFGDTGNNCSGLRPKITQARPMARKKTNSRKEDYTIKEAAALLEISEPVLRLTIRCGKIPAQTVPGKRGLRISRTNLLPFLDPLAAVTAGQTAS